MLQPILPSSMTDETNTYLSLLSPKYEPSVKVKVCNHKQTTDNWTTLAIAPRTPGIYKPENIKFFVATEQN